MLRAAGRAALSSRPFIDSTRTRYEPLLPLPALGALCTGTSMFAWLAKLGFVQITDATDILSLLAAPTGVALVAGAGAVAMHNMAQRLAALPEAERQASEDHARDLLYTTLLVGTISAACCHIEVAPPSARDL